MALIGAAGTIIAARVGSPGRPPSPKQSAGGLIVAPRSGESVARRFLAEGRLTSIPPDRRVWLVVQVGNLLFPKEPEIRASDHSWIQEVLESGDMPDGRFSLVLLMVDGDGQDEIEIWLAHGAAGGGYPGLESVSGSVKLDVATGLVLA